MSNKKEIQLERKSTKFVLLAILIPLSIVFILEHFGDFKASSMGSISDPMADEVYIDDARLHTRTFYTFFGNIVEENLYDKNIPLYRYSDGIYKVSPNYMGQIPYYVKGVLADIIYPLCLSMLLIGIYFFRKKFTIKLTESKENDI